MKPTLLSTLIAGLGLALTGAAQAAITGGVVKVGVLNDMSGPYADLAGPGSVVAAKMAVEDYIKQTGSKLKVEIVSADHQNKPDVGSSITRKWIDSDGVDMILDVPTSSVALAVNEVVKDKNKLMINSTGGTSDLTGKACTPNTVHWTYDTWMLAHGTGSAVVKQGGDTWFFLTADYAFGHALEKDTSDVVKAAGGKVLGNVRVPLGTTDFSSFLLQAQSSKAKIVGLANAGNDTINSIKQAAEFGIVAGGQKMAGLLVFLSDIHGLGLKTAQGLQVTTTFYWDMNDSTRAWSKRFAALNNNRMPTMVQAGVYAGLLHYLKAVDALQDDADGAKVVAKMKELPTDDPLFGKGTIRADGRKIHPAYLVEVKKPAESKYAYDYYKVLQTIPADQAFRPLNEGNCPLVK
ncbi:MAG TPA: ABC transporter substrate-binding protein [Rubrivivax sp.]|nr:ABC transporter substrate-binding protein [Burkholderiales bacterium]HNU11662.1 ABC transporter substrate-binding protein [Rubrivivax sp.]